jgi:hypothetical protein
MKLYEIVRQILPNESKNLLDYYQVKQYKSGAEFLPFEVGSQDQILQYLVWPMTTFHILSYILDTSDAYQKIVAKLGDSCWSNDHLKEAKILGVTWAEYLIKKENINTSIPKELHDLLFDVFKGRSPADKNEIKSLLSDTLFMTNLLILYTASDHCSQKIKNVISWSNDNFVTKYVSNIRKESMLKSLSEGLTEYGSVHYKTMTPQSGISLNSLSHAISYIKPGIECYTLSGRNENKYDLYHILILPWPLSIGRDFFEVDLNPPLKMDDDQFGFFSYTNKEKINADMIIYAIEMAENETALPDLIVIPECAIDEKDSHIISQQLINYFEKNRKPQPIIIYGAYSHSTTDKFGGNYLDYIYKDDFSGVAVRASQPKHHRWALDRNQIINYKLGTKLAPNKKWWENCNIDSRKILSYQDKGIHICPLICEDLARQDPIAPIVRSLGPNLVVALLLDGPQIKGRWPEKYASVLSEDPGSSVLSISPFGMTQRSTGGGHLPSAGVALWSDGDVTKTLDLGSNKIGINLVLEKRKVEQWTADGRRQIKASFKYAGHVSIGSCSELDVIRTQQIKGSLNSVAELA